MTLVIKRKEHTIKDIGIDIIDQYECSCGWKSKTYFDGREYAYADWEKHVEKSK